MRPTTPPVKLPYSAEIAPVSLRYGATDFEGSLYGCESRAVFAADEFDEEIDAVPFGEGNRIVEPGKPRNVDAAVSGTRARGNGNDFKLSAKFSGEFSAILLQDADEGSADIAQACHANAQGCLATRFTKLCHGLGDAGARFAAWFAAIAQVEDKQRIAGDNATKTGGRPTAGGNERFDGLAERLDIAHGGDMCIGFCLGVNRRKAAEAAFHKG